MDIDLSKENIRPLRGGRDQARLGAALQGGLLTEHVVNERRAELERALAEYGDGPDPLRLWFDHVTWLEQSCQHVDRAVDECLAAFEEDARYVQDARLVRLWIKWAERSDAPLETYQRLYDRGVGTLRFELYAAWATHAEEAGDYRKAEQVYGLGARLGAEPQADLERAHIAFRGRYAQHTLHSDDSPTKRKATTALQDTKRALTSLHAVKRRNVQTEHGGDHQQVHHVHVYEDAPGPSSFPPSYDAGASLNVQHSLLTRRTDENQKDIGTWTEAAGITKPKDVVLPDFTPYEDESADYRPRVCVPDPPDPTKIPMYDKAKVYVTEDNILKEYSPEEIRARKHRSRRNQTEMDCVSNTHPDTVTSSHNDKATLDAACANVMPSDGGSPAHEFDLEKVIAQSNSLLNADEDVVNYNAISSNDDREAFFIPSDLNGDDARVKCDVVGDFDRSLMANINESMTINTKAAHQTLNLFGETDASIFPMREIEEPKFDIREDHSMTMAAAVRAKNITRPETGVYANIVDENIHTATTSRDSMFPLSRDRMKNININEMSTMTFSCVTSTSTPLKPPQRCIEPFKRDLECVGVKMNHQTPRASYEKQNASGAVTPAAAASVAGNGRADGLYPIMETTREHRSTSSSSGSNFTTRNTLYSYTGRESSGLPVVNEKARDSNMNQENNSYQQYNDPNAYGRRMNYADQHQPYPTSDHQYHKSPAVNNYRYHTTPASRSNAPQYYQMPNNGYDYQNYAVNGAYQRNPVHQEYHEVYHNSPSSSVGYQSPQQQQQQGYQTDVAAVVVDQHVYMSPQQGYYSNGQSVTSPYQQQQQQNPVEYLNSSNKSFSNSPSQYLNVAAAAAQTSSFQQQQNQYYQYPSQDCYNNTNVQTYANHSVHSDNHARTMQQNHSFNGYHNDVSTVNYQHQSYIAAASAYKSPTGVQMSPYAAMPQQQHQVRPIMNNTYTPNNLDSSMSKQRTAYQSPTSKLRSVRHEAPQYTKTNNSIHPGYSNQYINFITANEPKDDAPKFGASPTISQKMHKNLYVSSPEQAQIPQDHDTSASSSSIIDKLKDPSRRQLDFEIPKSEPFQMDIDDSNSADCQNVTSFKSYRSNDSITTRDLPKPATIDFPAVIDPFNIELCNSLMQYVKFPNGNHCDGYYEMKTVPKLQQGIVISVDNLRFSVEKQLGKGTFGCVFRGLDINNQESIALKYQKPGHPWEYYICREIKARIEDPYMLPGYMDVRYGFFSDHASVFVSELSTYGSLLDVANRIRTATTKCVGELVVMLLASEMLSILHHLHKAEIIHADIKPDNFLLMKIPQTESRAPSLQLIDFGCAIDMSLFPSGTTFKKVISTDGFTCTEMRDGRPWTYQTDLYCLAGTVYVVLMGNYMQTVNRGGRWVVEKKWPRYMKSAMWDSVFSTLLNVDDCSSFPDLLAVKDSLDAFLRSDEMTLSSQLRNFEHVLRCK